MTLLAPLGFLGLASIIALIIIYIIRPNYQQKFISSTFVWKLSLNYRRKKIPASKLRNILLILCQIMTLILATFILVQPYITKGADMRSNEKVCVIDASAGMLVSDNTGKSRFNRAIEQATDLCQDTIDANGIVTVIIADYPSAYVLAERVTADTVGTLWADLAELSLDNEGCSYGQADIDGAMDFAADILLANPLTEVYLYTGVKYTEKGNVHVVDVATDTEFNSAILDVTKTLTENRYVFEIEAACYKYGRGNSLDIDVKINGANRMMQEDGWDGGTNYFVKIRDVEFLENETKIIEIDTKENNNPNITIYVTDENGEPIDGVTIYSFDSVEVMINDVDSYMYDNSFSLYGGNREYLRVVYESYDPNDFIPTMMAVLRNQVYATYDIDFTMINTKDAEMVTSGYDLYIFEMLIPDPLPDDGVVWILDPQVKNHSEFDILGLQSTAAMTPLVATEESLTHPITQKIESDDIIVSRYSKINPDSLADYEVLFSVAGGDPAVFYKNTMDSKVFVIAFSLNYSNLPISYHFPVMVLNFFNYYFPVTSATYAYNIYDEITLNARGDSLDIYLPNSPEPMPPVESLPVTITAKAMGTYTMTQTLINGTALTQKLYVRLDAIHSDITREVELLTNPYFPAKPSIDGLDLLFYISAAMTLFLFLEWWLQSRENF